MKQKFWYVLSTKIALNLCTCWDEVHIYFIRYLGKYHCTIKRACMIVQHDIENLAEELAQVKFLQCNIEICSKYTSNILFKNSLDVVKHQNMAGYFGQLWETKGYSFGLMVVIFDLVPLGNVQQCFCKRIITVCDVYSVRACTCMVVLGKIQYITEFSLNHFKGIDFQNIPVMLA